ncbi:RT0821/Lpp0805 family surface protein [Chelativorans sp.]|uniref:RT0821/Lpp0805 family surface protein n=1 Tax=Chelativorans sp. TaxID=2203393 RepID=UPI0028126C5D|nr:RT0821/Lpp0805 family surface protein [Chelativorans sp.]
MLVFLAVAIQGCSFGGGKNAVDTVLTTSAVPPAQVFPDENLAKDGQAILAALSSGPAAGSLPWENPESGARGLITAYSGEAEEGRDCLAFTTTRESFDGVGLYEGEACKDAAGIMRMRAFEPR